MQNIFAYVRVSTEEQALHGLSRRQRPQDHRFIHRRRYLRQKARRKTARPPAALEGRPGREGRYGHIHKAGPLVPEHSGILQGAGGP